MVRKKMEFSRKAEEKKKKQEKNTALCASVPEP